MEPGAFISIEKANKLVEKKQAKIIDVRDPVSFRDGTISGATNVPLRAISTLVKTDKKTPLIVFGDKETQDAALRYIFQLGFNDVYRLSEHTAIAKS